MHTHFLPAFAPAVLCTQPRVGEHHTKKTEDARQPKRLLKQHKHTICTSATRHTTPAPAHTTPSRSDLLRTACAPTSTYSDSNGFCDIRVIELRILVRVALWKWITRGTRESPRHRARGREQRTMNRRPVRDTRLKLHACFGFMYLFPTPHVLSPKNHACRLLR
jgi:hypothetical protein